MTITVEMALLVSIVSVAFSVYFGLKNAKRTDAKEIEERVKTDTRINMKLDSIGSNVEDVKADMSTMKEDIKNMDKRLVIVEQSAKSLHHRVDTMEERIDHRIGE